MDEINTQTTPQPTTIEKIENSLKDIYCISGLGADERVFQKLNFQGYQPVHICWIEPEPRERISDYARRLTKQIRSESPILIGLSFGGLIAMEIAKQIDTEKVILISSAKDRQEIPFYFQLFRFFPIYRLLPAQLMLWLGQLIASWFFSLETIDERQLFRAILFDTDAKFMKWAVDRVVTWKNELVPDNVFHIHGESDRIFPIPFVEADFCIAKGGHFMIMNRAEYVSELIQKIVDLPLNETGDGKE